MDIYFDKIKLAILTTLSTQCVYLIRWDHLLFMLILKCLEVLWSLKVVFDFPLNRFSFHNYVTARSNKKVTFNLLTSMESSSNMEVVGPEEETVGKQQVVVGVCAMEKKTLSRPMTEILTRLEEFEYIKPLIFPESVIINVSL